MPEIDVLLETYEGELSRNPHTQATNLIYARAFLQHSGGDLTRAAVLDFLEAVSHDGAQNPLPRKRAASPGTRRTVFRILARLFASNDVAWPFKKGEGPQVSYRAQRHVALGPLAVGKAITAAREGDLTHQEAAFLALSCTYGMRKQEIAAVLPEHLDYRRCTLFVATLKHGAERYHLVPPEILPVLKLYRFQERLTPDQAHQVWNGIAKKSGLPAVKGLGFHAIRRMLVTLLWEKVAPGVLTVPALERFLRWQAGEEQKMSSRYHSIQVVGLEDVEVDVDQAQLDADAAIFKIHPFLPMWR